MTGAPWRRQPTAGWSCSKAPTPHRRLPREQHLWVRGGTLCPHESVSPAHCRGALGPGMTKSTRGQGLQQERGPQEGPVS